MVEALGWVAAEVLAARRTARAIRPLPGLVVDDTAQLVDAAELMPLDTPPASARPFRPRGVGGPIARRYRALACDVEHGERGRTLPLGLDHTLPFDGRRRVSPLAGSRTVG